MKQVCCAAQTSVLDTVAPHVSAPPAERRAHPRLLASELRGLKAARVKYGPEVNVIDLSVGGVLFETTGALAPDASLVLEFASQKSTILVPARLLRCHNVIAAAGHVHFEAACAFRRPLALDDFIAAGHPATANGSTAAWQRVGARFRDGRLMNGYTNDFHPSKPYVNLSTTATGLDVRFTQVAQLEALYFVRGNDDDLPRDTRPPAAITHGRKIEVTLPNGDVILGSTLNYRRDGNGFFVHPADARSNNLRVFVAPGATQHVRFL